MRERARRASIDRSHVAAARLRFNDDMADRCDVSMPLPPRHGADACMTFVHAPAASPPPVAAVRHASLTHRSIPRRGIARDRPAWTTAAWRTAARRGARRTAKSPALVYSASQQHAA
ncbi:hypothetical protein ACVBGC_26115 [Burkholderia stagnalis]